MLRAKWKQKLESQVWRMMRERKYPIPSLNEFFSSVFTEWEPRYIPNILEKVIRIGIDQWGNITIRLEAGSHISNIQEGQQRQIEQLPTCDSQIHTMQATGIASQRKSCSIVFFRVLHAFVYNLHPFLTRKMSGKRLVLECIMHRRNRENLKLGVKNIYFHEINSSVTKKSSK